MNERINKLFGQAMDQSIPETWTTLTHSQLSILKDKFAELIVKECCQKLEDDGMVEVAIEMKQHFGVDGMSTEDKKTLIKELLGVKND